MNNKEKIQKKVNRYPTIKMVNYKETDDKIEILLYDQYNTGEQFDEVDLNGLTIELEEEFEFKSVDWTLNNGWKDNDAEYAEVTIIKRGDHIDERKEKLKEIEEIRKEIKEFADHDQYSVNNPYVKSLYQRLRKLEGRVEEIDWEEEMRNYTPQFIGDSDVPINGHYE